MSDLLNVIFTSDKRRNLLILLNSGPKKGWDEIKQPLMVTSTGMLPQVKILEEEHLIERDGKKFYLTPIEKCSLGTWSRLSEPRMYSIKIKNSGMPRPREQLPGGCKRSVMLFVGGSKGAVCQLHSERGSWY